MRQSWKSGALALTLAAGAHLALFSLNWPHLPSEPVPEPAVTVELREAPSPPPAAAAEPSSPEVITTSGKSRHQVADPIPTEPSPKKPVATQAPHPAPPRSTIAADKAAPSRPDPIRTQSDAVQAPPLLSVPESASTSDKPAQTPRVISRAPNLPGNAETAATGSPTQGQGTNPEAARSGYRQQLETHLNQYQRYPASAQRMRQTGTVEVAFVIDRQGHLVSSELLSRTPFPLLNREALALLKRAVPFPPVPESLTDDELHWELPIHFRLN